MDKNLKEKNSSNKDIKACNDQLGENASGETLDYDLKSDSCNKCSKTKK